MASQVIPLFDVAKHEGYPTHAALARLLGFTQPNINRLARGKRGVSLRLRNSVKCAFPQYDPDYLLGLAPNSAAIQDGVEREAVPA